jgi:hypothetical protein
LGAALDLDRLDTALSLVMALGAEPPVAGITEQRAYKAHPPTTIDTPGAFAATILATAAFSLVAGISQ